MRLIDADALKAEWNEPTDWMDRDQVLRHITWFRAVIDNMPTIDPVKHGRWIDMGDNSASICSVCKGKTLLNYESDYHKSDYCPHCGAKMDKKEN